MSSTPTASVLINGVPSEVISPFDRGLQYGDGLFETIACLSGRPRFLPLHMERLEFGCERLQLPAPPFDEISNEIRQLAGAADRSIIKLILTAGVALARGYSRGTGETATRITVRHPWPHEDPARLHDGVMARTLTLRLGENPRLAGLKHCNRLEQILARHELAADPQFEEGVLFSSSGNLVSGTLSNIFLVREGTVLTPRIDQCGVLGVMRRVVLREARQAGIPTRECELRAENLLSAEEVFFTNARLGILPLRALDGRDLAPGPVTRHLQSVLEPLLKEPQHA